MTLSPTESEGPRRRAYDSSRRRAAAAARRQRVLEVAAERFATHGWARTTIAAVAQEAGVSVDLITHTIGTKSELLLAALRATSFGDEAPDLREAVLGLGLAELDDVGERLQVLSGFLVRMMAQMMPLIPALEQAADSSADARVMMQGLQVQRRETTRLMLEAITGGPVPEDLIDETMVLTSAPIYLQFVPGLGWRPEQYAGWLADTMRAALGRHGVG
ncbi:TetR/AcrR family transcriptional regulator [Nocardioides sp.]|uniref:TetR/AcrR family transcriptional regulator n=1 Tax=Nocardioides sp. TaxID=35761 RepID=UPI003511D30B